MAPHRNGNAHLHRARRGLRPSLRPDGMEDFGELDGKPCAFLQMRGGGGIGLDVVSRPAHGHHQVIKVLRHHFPPIAAIMARPLQHLVSGWGEFAHHAIASENAFADARVGGKHRTLAPNACCMISDVPAIAAKS